MNEEINQPRLSCSKISPHLSIIPGISSQRRGIFNFVVKHSLTSLPLHTSSRHVAGKRDAEKQQVSEITLAFQASLTDGTGTGTVEKGEGVGVERRELEEKRPVYRWPGWECIGTKRQNTSAVSSGTQTTDCDWSDCSQEVKPRSLQYNRGWRECKRAG